MAIQIISIEEILWPEPKLEVCPRCGRFHLIEVRPWNRNMGYIDRYFLCAGCCYVKRVKKEKNNV